MFSIGATRFSKPVVVHVLYCKMLMLLHNPWKEDRVQTREPGDNFVYHMFREHNTVAGSLARGGIEHGGSSCLVPMRDKSPTMLRGWFDGEVQGWGDGSWLCDRNCFFSVTFGSARMAYDCELWY